MKERSCFLPSRGLVDGYDVARGIIEIDETYIGGKLRTGSRSTKPGEKAKDRPAGTANKAAVVAVLQRGGPVRSHHIDCVTAKNLKPIVRQMVRKDAHLMTDSSNVLASAGTGLRHDQVYHRAGEYARREKGVLISTNSVESYFAIVKRGHFGVYHHWSRKYLGQYLREFDWRYNVRGLPDMERTIVALKMPGGKRLLLKPPASA